MWWYNLFLNLHAVRVYLDQGGCCEREYRKCVKKRRKSFLDHRLWPRVALLRPVWGAVDWCALVEYWKESCKWCDDPSILDDVHDTCLNWPVFMNRNMKRLVSILPIRIVKSNVSSVGPSSETTNARNARLYYPNRQYTNLFIFRFVSLLCLRSTLRLFYLYFQLAKISFASSSRWRGWRIRIMAC